MTQALCDEGVVWRRCCKYTWALTFENFWQSTGLGLGPDSRFLRLEANCVHTHLDINEVVEKYKRFAISKVVYLYISVLT